MIKVYSAADKSFQTVEPHESHTLPEGTVWVDLNQPSSLEEAWLEKELGLKIPTREDMDEIEPSSRLYQDGATTTMTATLLWKSDSDIPDTTNVSFLLNKGVLVTVRYAEPKPFAMCQMHALQAPELYASGALMMVGLLEAVVDRTADVLEKVSAQVHGISRSISERRRREHDARRSSMELEVLMNDVVFNQNVATQIRVSLVSLGRMVAFMPVAKEFQARGDREDLKERMASLAHDIQSLTDHTGFLNDTTGFLLNAALGFINIEQNAIIKIFSIAAVVFLPPTLIASIYGMNFKYMPELDWGQGYLVALFLMILSGVLPYLWFKRRGWM
jgi:magnesium transporter